MGSFLEDLGENIYDDLLRGFEHLVYKFKNAVAFKSADKNA